MFTITIQYGFYKEIRLEIWYSTSRLWLICKKLQSALWGNISSLTRKQPVLKTFASILLPKRNANYYGYKMRVKKGNRTLKCSGALNITNLQNEELIHSPNRAVARTLIGGVYIHIFRFCPTDFFWNQRYFKRN